MSEGGDRRLHRIGAVAARAGGGEAKNPKLRIAVRSGLGLLVLGFLVLYVASQWSELQERDVRIDLVWLTPAVAVVILVHVQAAYGWDLLLRALGHYLKPVRAQMVWGQSVIARYVPGTVLMLVGRVLLAEREGVPRRTTFASMIYEQGIQVAAATLLGSYALLGTNELAGWERGIALAIPPLMLVFVHPRVFGPLAGRALRALGREPLPRLLPFRVVLMLLVYYIFAWAAYGLGAYVAGQVVFDLELADLPAVIAAQSLGYTASVVTVIFPGGLGVRDTAFALVLKPAVGGSFALAAAIAIAVRLVSIIGEVIYVGGATLWANRHPPGPVKDQGTRAAT